MRGSLDAAVDAFIEMRRDAFLAEEWLHQIMRSSACCSFNETDCASVGHNDGFRVIEIGC